MARRVNLSLMPQAIGLALYFIMFRFPFLGLFLTDSTRYSRDVHAIIETLFIAIGIALAVFAHRIPVLSTKGACSISGGVLSALSIAAMGLCSIAGILPQIALFPAGIFFALGFLLLSEAWFQSIRTLPSKHLIPLCTFAFGISMASGFLELLSVPTKAASFALIPLLSAACAYVTFDAHFTRGMLEDYERPSFPEALQIDILAIVFIFAEIVFAALIRSLWAHQGLGHASENGTGTTYLFSLMLGLLLCLTTINSRYAEEAAGISGGITLLALIIGAFSYAFMQGAYGASAAITSCYSALQVVLMCLISLVFRGKHRPYSGSSDIFCALIGFGSALSYNILPRTIGFEGFAPSSVALPTIFFAIGFIILVLAGSFVLTLLRSVSQFKDWQSNATVKSTAIKAVHVAVSQKGTDTNENPNPENLTEKLVSTYGLTDRETDIAILLANGFTARRASEELYLSLNTVNSYTKTIYRKMDVHKKDELIEKVNALL